MKKIIRRIKGWVQSCQGVTAGNQVKGSSFHSVGVRIHQIRWYYHPLPVREEISTTFREDNWIISILVHTPSDPGIILLEGHPVETTHIGGQMCTGYWWHHDL